jgi:hypothetical protein
MINYIAQMEHNEFENAPLIFRSGPFNIGENMSDHEEFDTLGPLPPRDDGNQENLSESSPLLYGDQRPPFITDMTPDDHN